MSTGAKSTAPLTSCSSTSVSLTEAYARATLHWMGSGQAGGVEEESGNGGTNLGEVDADRDQWRAEEDWLPTPGPI